jgi:hypothetical protein
MLTVVGDSISKGYCRHILPKVRRVGSKNSNQLIKCLSKISGVIAINCGLHDIKKVNGNLAVDELQYAKNIQLLSNLDIAWITTTPVDDEMHAKRGAAFDRYNEDVIRYNKIATDIMTKAGVKVIDLYEFTISILGEDGYRDGVHFKGHIMRQQGQWLSQQLFVA